MGAVSEPARQAILNWEESLGQLQEWLPEQGALSSSAPPAATMIEPAAPVLHVASGSGRQSSAGSAWCLTSRCQPNSPLASSAGALVATIARLASLASENHQLQRRLTRSGLLYELSRTLTSSLDIERRPAIYHRRWQPMRWARETSALLLVAAEWREFVVAVAHGVAANAYTLKQLPIDDGIAGWVAQTGLPLIVNAPAGDPIFSPLLDRKTGYATRNAAGRSFAARGNILGVLLVTNTEDSRDFAVEDMEWLAALAAQASIAIENARLYSSLRDERDRIIQAEEDLRRRLAGNLHDERGAVGRLVADEPGGRTPGRDQPAGAGQRRAGPPARSGATGQRRDPPVVAGTATADAGEPRAGRRAAGVCQPAAPAGLCRDR